jgi:hypothetical protein
LRFCGVSHLESRVSYLAGRLDADGHFEDGGGAGAEQDGAADFADERGHVAGLVVAEGLGVEAVFVAEGQVVEEVFDGVDTALGERDGDALTYTLEELDGRGEVEGHGVDGSKAGSGEWRVTSDE